MTVAATAWSTPQDGRLRVVPVRELDTDLIGCAERARNDGDALTVGVLSDVAGFLRARPALLVPTAWRPHPSRYGMIVVLTGRALATAAVEVAVREAGRLGASVVVVQPFRGTEACLPCSSGMRYVETAQQEQLDIQLAEFDARSPGPRSHHVPLIGELVWGGVDAAVRRLAPGAALVVAETSAFDSPLLRPALDTTLEDVAVPLLTVPTSAPGMPE
jgi:hypothetical protein